jgi:tRNA pseudouridine38-40 synthase
MTSEVTGGRYRMSVAYDGSGYSGWQVQPGRITVQGELERVLAELTSEAPRVHCSGRTDTGVHARDQVTHFDLVRGHEPRRLIHGCNALLRDDIRVMRLRRCPAHFDARRSATGKEYRYFLWNGPILPPHLRHQRTHVRRPLDAAAMSEAAALLVGRHDFAAFAANPHQERGGTVRSLWDLDVRRKGHEIVIVAGGEGFLYKMVRSLAGFLIRVGAGELAVPDTVSILASRQRTARVPTAPPQGLFLWKVRYAKRSP